LITFYTSQTQPVTVGCLNNTKYPYDADCLTYTYNADYTKLVCNKCTTKTLITAVGDLSASPITYTYCSSAAITGCNKYVVI
jgi:hypothetical protein